MEKILIQQNNHWKEKQYERLYDRAIMKELVKKLTLREMMVFIGVRRCGKSTILKLLINHLLKATDAKQILYINFDDPFYSEVYQDAKKIYQIVEIAEKLTGNKIDYLLLDEIQHVQQWEQFVKSVYDSELFKKICITGSNSMLLNSEYATLISGRFVVDEIFPFSFFEILHNSNIDNYFQLIENKSKVLSIVDNLLSFGGYPEIFKHSDNQLKRELILNYFDTILFKDCIARGKIRDIKKFQEVAYYIISNAGTLFSYNSMADAVVSNDVSIKEFIRNLESSFLIYEIPSFSFSLKKQIRNKKKHYCIDNGFLSNVSFRFSSNAGKLFENLVFTEFIKRKQKLFFYNEQKECDFIVQDGNNRLKAIQVCYELNEHNQKREIAGIQAVKKMDYIDDATLITYDHETEIENIKVVPFWKYFSGF